MLFMGQSTEESEMKKVGYGIGFCFLLFALSSICIAQPQTGKPLPKIPSAQFHITEATSEIKIDGDLSEDAWAKATVIPIPFEWQPGDNTPSPVKTECLVTYSKSNLYIAFRNFDPNPSQIRAHIMDRDATDSFIQDDHVGVMIDPFNDERRAVQFRVNPFGVQMDAIFSDQDGVEDWSWDIIWNSAGKITEQGYTVEIAIPFNQLRFPNQSGEQTWGFEAFRSWPRNVRHRMSSRWTDRNTNCILCQENKIIGLQGVSPGRNLEFDPTATTHRTEQRADFPNGDLKSDGTDFDPGLTARYGITSNMTLNGAVNPDFSQVEADVAQLAINTRFALFFSEKRPFFLEGSDSFLTPLQILFTRTVADPDWGGKLTGKQGNNLLGVFVTRDSINNLIFPSNQESSFDSFDENITGEVMRYRRDIFKNSTIGMLYSGREGDEYHNRQFSIDGFNRLSNADSIAYQYIHSDTQYPFAIASDHDQPFGSFPGDAYSFNWDHFARNWAWRTHYEDLGTDFRSDSGFIPRVDTRTGRGFFQRNFWPSGNTTWFTRGDVGFHYLRTTDHDGTLTDQEIQGYADYQGPLQSLLSGVYTRVKTFFSGVTYDQNRYDLFGQIKPNGTLAFTVTSQLGDAIDFENNRPATIVLLNPIMEVKVGSHVNLNFNHTLQHLDVEGERLFSANLSQFRLLYHFNVRMFARAIFQYTDIDRDPNLYLFSVDPKTKHLFTQFLFSYKLNPQTVLFVGYSDNHIGTDEIDLTQTDRTFFMKIGYALVF
jgi:Domain of unknown function (DUF5916)/Carbohydrate family 9 binding domain-like